MDKQDSNTQLEAFLMDDYKEKVRYLGDQFTRMWNRFNFMLTVESGIFVVFVVTVPTYQPWIAGLGILVSLIWYTFGAQDRYLVVLYRREIENTLERLKTLPPLDKLDESPYYYYTGQTETTDDNQLDNRLRNPRSLLRPKDTNWKAIWYQWRSGVFSTTKLAAQVPALIVLAWAVVLYLTASGHVNTCIARGCTL